MCLVQFLYYIRHKTQIVFGFLILTGLWDSICATHRYSKHTKVIKERRFIGWECADIRHSCGTMKPSISSGISTKLHIRKKKPHILIHYSSFRTPHSTRKSNVSLTGPFSLQKSQSNQKISPTCFIEKCKYFSISSNALLSHSESICVMYYTYSYCIK